MIMLLDATKTATRSDKLLLYNIHQVLKCRLHLLMHPSNGDEIWLIQHFRSQQFSVKHPAWMVILWYYDLARITLSRILLKIYYGMWPYIHFNSFVILYLLEIFTFFNFLLERFTSWLGLSILSSQDLANNFFIFIGERKLKGFSSAINITLVSIFAFF